MRLPDILEAPSPSVNCWQSCTFTKCISTLHHPLTQTGTGLCSVKAIVPLLFTLRWHSAVIFPLEELKSFRRLDGHMSGHAEMHHVKGVDMSTGSLGQGISAAVGMALAGKLDSKDYRTYAILGDGEIQEGQVWEAAMAAGNYGLDNLCAIVDNNNIQIDGTIEEIMSPYPIDRKFEDFGWNVVHCDGHDPADIAAAFDAARACKGKPTMLIAHTVKGKGVSFMENSAEWHGNDPNTEQYLRAAAELDELVMKAEKEASAHE